MPSSNKSDQRYNRPFLKYIQSSSSQSVKISEDKVEIYFEFCSFILFIRAQYLTKYDMYTFDWMYLTAHGD